MVVIISNKVLDSIYDYAKSLTNYPICSSRARQKVDQLISALNALGSSISTPSVCMNKDLLQPFDRKGKPINKNLKRFNYKDESNFQWAFACLYDYENDTIIVLKMMPSIFIKETLADRINIIVEKNLNKFALRKALLENNNTKTQYMMKNRIRLTESQLHGIIRQCVNEAANKPIYLYHQQTKYGIKHPTDSVRGRYLRYSPEDCSFDSTSKWDKNKEYDAKKMVDLIDGAMVSLNNAREYADSMGHSNWYYLLNAILGELNNVLKKRTWHRRAMGW